MIHGWTLWIAGEPTETTRSEVCAYFDLSGERRKTFISFSKGFIMKMKKNHSRILHLILKELTQRFIWGSLKGAKEQAQNPKHLSTLLSGRNTGPDRN